MKADINALRKRQPTQINKITQNKVIAPANRTAGTHYAIGPMIPKISSNSQLTCPSRTDTGATPLLKKNRYRDPEVRDVVNLFRTLAEMGSILLYQKRIMDLYHLTKHGRMK